MAAQAPGARGRCQVGGSLASGLRLEPQNCSLALYHKTNPNKIADFPFRWNLSILENRSSRNLRRQDFKPYRRWVRILGAVGALRGSTPFWAKRVQARWQRQKQPPQHLGPQRCTASLQGTEDKHMHRPLIRQLVSTEPLSWVTRERGADAQRLSKPRLCDGSFVSLPTALEEEEYKPCTSETGNE